MSHVPSVAQGVVTYPVEVVILVGDEIAEVAGEIAALGGQAGGFGGGLGFGGGAAGGAGGGRAAGGGAASGLLDGIELPEGVTIQQVLQALANNEALPAGVTLPEGFEVPEQLLQRFAGGGQPADGAAPGAGARQQGGGLAARPMPAPGMSASVTILTEVRAETVLVPTSAVRQLDRAFSVTVPAPDGATERVIVEVGASDGTNVEVVSGLEAGDAVLIGADSEGIAFSATQQAQQAQQALPAGGFGGGGFGGFGGGVGFGGGGGGGGGGGQ